jgi:hypothetical protein
MLALVEEIASSLALVAMTRGVVVWRLLRRWRSSQ